MSIGNKFVDWCKVPPPAPKNNHKKLLASGIICTILSVSIFAGLPIYGTLMTGSAGSLVASGTILSIANLGQGPLYIQNATYQQIAEANNSTVQNYEKTMERIADIQSGGLYFGGGGSINSTETSASLSTTVINLGDEDLTATSIEIYRGGSLFAQINGPFIVKAHSVGAVVFQMHNLTALSNDEARLITQFRQQGESDVEIFAGRVMYNTVLKTSEGFSVSFEKLVLPTAYSWPYCG